jgi:hypothetical protein
MYQIGQQDLESGLFRGRHVLDGLVERFVEDRVQHGFEGFQLREKLLDGLFRLRHGANKVRRWSDRKCRRREKMSGRLSGAEKRREAARNSVRVVVPASVAFASGRGGHGRLARARIPLGAQATLPSFVGQVCVNGGLLQASARRTRAPWWQYVDW